MAISSLEDCLPLILQSLTLNPPNQEIQKPKFIRKEVICRWYPFTDQDTATRQRTVVIRNSAEIERFSNLLEDAELQRSISTLQAYTARSLPDIHGQGSLSPEKNAKESQ